MTWCCRQIIYINKCQQLYVTMASHERQGNQITINSTVYSTACPDKHKENIKCIYLSNANKLWGEHDDVIKWGHFPRYCPFVRGIHRSPVNSPHRGQWRRPLIFSFDPCLNKRLSKQSWCWRLETPSRPLWLHFNDSHKCPAIRNASPCERGALFPICCVLWCGTNSSITVTS